MKINVSIIIVNYNSDELTIRAVESIINNVKSVTYEIIIIDNSECDTISNKLSYESISYHKTDSNLGFGKANNIGYSMSKGNYLFLLNNDAYLTNDIFSVLFPFMEDASNSNIAICTPCLIDETGKPSLSHGNFLNKKRIQYDIGFYKPTSEEVLNNKMTNSLSCNTANRDIRFVDWVSGAAMFIRVNVINEIGLFNELFFMYFEDMELCYRYYKAGYYSVVLPTQKVVHLGGDTWNKSSIRLHKKYKIILRSKYLMASNFLNPIEIIIYKNLEYLKYIIRRGRSIILHIFKPV